MLIQLGISSDILVYFIFVEHDLHILMLYVDDLFLIWVDKRIGGCKADIVTELDIKDIDMMHYLFGL